MGRFLGAAIAGASAIVAALASGAFGALLGYYSADRQMDVKMLEIAVGILSKDPTDNIAPAREWAVDVIQNFAEVKLTEEARQSLIDNPAVRWSNGGFGDYYETWTSSGGDQSLGPIAPTDKFLKPAPNTTLP